MEKWEYCKLEGVSDEKYFWPKLTFYTRDGEKIENLKGKDEKERVSKRIAELGLEGWEIIAIVPVAGMSTRVIYFKRPISN